MANKKKQTSKPFADRFPTRDSLVLEILANNVRALRKESGLSQASLAIVVAIEQTEISKIENRRGNPTILTCERLADALGVPLPALLKPEARQKKASREKP
jgi:transcriptional regulator with XRE-family HTH domain